MISAVRNWLQRRAQRKIALARQSAAIDDVARHFIATTRIQPMGCAVVHDSTDELVIRVMHVEGRIPPERTWYSVASDGTIVKLSTQQGLKFDKAVWR